MLKNKTKNIENQQNNISIQKEEKSTQRTKKCRKKKRQKENEKEERDLTWNKLEHECQSVKCSTSVISRPELVAIGALATDNVEGPLLADVELIC